MGNYKPDVAPTELVADDKESTGKQGQPQEGTPTFEGGDPVVPIDTKVPATFEDGTVEKVIPDEGTYAVAEDGTVTFTPEKSFTGKGTGVTVKRVDENDTPVTATYTPTVIPIKTVFEDENGSPIAPEQGGTQPHADVPGYFFTGKTTVDEDGNTHHTYRKIVTSIPNDYPTVERPELDLPIPDVPVPDDVPQVPTPQPKEEVPVVPEVAKPTPSELPEQSSNEVVATLPNTGESRNSLAAVGIATLMASLGLGYTSRRRRKED